MANAGAINNPSTRKSTEPISQSINFTLRVSGGSLNRPEGDATHRPAAPSVNGDELPAVRVP
jgi:hypothetical protein